MFSSARMTSVASVNVTTIKKHSIYIFSQYNLSLNISVYFVYNYVTFNINTLKSTLSCALYKIEFASGSRFFLLSYCLFFFTANIILSTSTSTRRKIIHSIVVFVTLFESFKSTMYRCRGNLSIVMIAECNNGPRERIFSRLVILCYNTSFRGASSQNRTVLACSNCRILTDRTQKIYVYRGPQVHPR